MRSSPGVSPPYFAQFGEDRILAEIFGSKESGTCVEVGAFDGITGSTTYYFERLGWRCLLVEPDPEMADKIRQVRLSTVVCCAASSTVGTTNFTIVDTDRQSSGVTPSLNDERRKGKQQQHTIQVKTDTLDNMLREYVSQPPIDFISIDVEGTELDVIRGLSLETWKPSILIIEANDSEICHYMTQANYRWILRTGVNDWYLRNDEKTLISPRLLHRIKGIALAAKIEKSLYVVFKPLALALPQKARNWIKHVIERAVT